MQNCRVSAEQAFEILGINGHRALFRVTILSKSFEKVQKLFPKTRSVSTNMIGVRKFLFFNSVLPAFDIGTDLNAFLVYSAYYDDDIDNYHPKWAVLTLNWMFAPFGIHIGKFLYRILTNRVVSWRDELIELVIHIPFVQPLRNAWLAWRLYKMRFGFS